jgi:hypothetical protein
MCYERRRAEACVDESAHRCVFITCGVFSKFEFIFGGFWSCIPSMKCDGVGTSCGNLAVIFKTESFRLIVW